MSKIGHKAILASAGSGKTFQLAHRYIRLLADESETITPDRICAMTFTRKAAGEIFDSIANYLREAASDPKAARLTATERIHMPHLKQNDFLRLLRRFFDDLHRARIGTLDSFIVGIAKAFALELGIPMNFQLAESGPALAKEYRQEVLNRILAPKAGRGSIAHDFLQAFKQATYGHEEKTFGKVLDKFLDELRIHYRLCPDAEKWGNENVIWPGKGRPWKGTLKVDLQSEADTITTWTADQTRTNTTDQRFYSSLAGIAASLAGYGPNSAWENALAGTVFERLLENLTLLKDGPVTIPYSRKEYALPAAVAGSLYKLLHHLHVIEFDRILRRTKGLYNLLKNYEAMYKVMSRGTGSFSFTDIQYLLAGPSASGGGPVISRTNEDDANKLYIDYRMDCRLDHWLLDEFQDTSDLQWAVFENLIDEIVQAPAGERRSFFYVGDVKQAIYRWRGGNHELFHQVLNRFGKVIELESMAKTRRCAQPIVDAVNKVFGTLPDDLLPAGAIGNWKKVWQKHETTEKDAPGYVTILEPTAADDAEEARYVLAADILKEIQPVHRELSVGILVRKNKAGKELVNVLRRECRHMSFVHEGEAAITENEVAQVLLSLVKMAVHPGDEFAWKYIQMGPMAGALREHKINRWNIAPQLLSEIGERGFQDFARKWGGLLDDANDLGDYGHECLKRFECAAAEFDEVGSCSCSSFLHFMSDYTIREQPSSRAVRVMTIHQAKGLEFDIVILPELQTAKGGKSMARAGALELVRAGSASRPDWILKMPKKILAERDPELSRQLQRVDEEHCFDCLCLLYVAMTRPKHGLYIVTSLSSGRTVHHSSFVKKQLVGDVNSKDGPNVELGGRKYVRLYESEKGREKWYEEEWPEKEHKPVEVVSHNLPDGYASLHERRPVLLHREPSKQAGHTRTASMLFDAEGSDVMDFGSAIHELLQQVEWRTGDVDIEKIIAEWGPVSHYSKEVTSDVIAQFRQCMNVDTVREHLAGPGGNVTLWREKRFEIVLGNELVSGAFDRVTIVRDDTGKPASAVVLDYKSSRADKSADIDKRAGEYTSQMTAYRKALSTILGLPENKIELYLLFTRQAVIRKI